MGNSWPKWIKKITESTKCNEEVLQRVEKKLETAASALQTTNSNQAEHHKSTESVNARLCDMFMAVVETREERIAKKVLKTAAKMTDKSCILALMSKAQPMLKPTGPGCAPTREQLAKYDAGATADFLRANGFSSFADHFQAEDYNGMALLAVDNDDVAETPETNKLKRKTFLKFVTDLQQQL